VAIRKELQAIRNSEKSFSEKEFKDYINHLLTEDCFQPRIVEGKDKKKQDYGGSIEGR
jgi:hypothetical protein